MSIDLVLYLSGAVVRFQAATWFQDFGSGMMKCLCAILILLMLVGTVSAACPPGIVIDTSFNQMKWVVTKVADQASLDKIVKDNQKYGANCGERATYNRQAFAFGANYLKYRGYGQIGANKFVNNATGKTCEILYQLPMSTMKVWKFHQNPAPRILKPSDYSLLVGFTSLKDTGAFFYAIVPGNADMKPGGKDILVDPLKPGVWPKGA